MNIKQCQCITQNGPCKCGQDSASQLPVQFPDTTETAAPDPSGELDASAESFRCVCPEERKDGHSVGKPCACNSALEPMWLPTASAVARDVQVDEILPVIPDTPLPPLAKPRRPLVHCLCLIHDINGVMRPCACNRATTDLGYVDYTE